MPATLPSTPGLRLWRCALVGTWASTGSGTSLKDATVSGGNIAALTSTASADGSALTGTSGAVNYDLAAAGGTTPASVSANTIRYTGAGALTPGMANTCSGSTTLNGTPVYGDGGKTIVISSLKNSGVSSEFGSGSQAVHNGAVIQTGATGSSNRDIQLNGTSGFHVKQSVRKRPGLELHGGSSARAVLHPPRRLGHLAAPSPPAALSATLPTEIHAPQGGRNLYPISDEIIRTAT